MCIVCATIALYMALGLFPSPQEMHASLLAWWAAQNCRKRPTEPARPAAAGAAATAAAKAAAPAPAAASPAEQEGGGPSSPSGVAASDLEMEEP